MASNPGILTHWPWETLGNFKYGIVAPMVVHSMYSFLTKPHETIIIYPLITLLMLWRMLHNQIWITFSRYRTARGDNLIVDRSLDFDQVDRERTWDDQIILNWILMYAALWGLECVRKMRLWRSDGVLVMLLLHAGPVEFLYYWLHRALHHHFLYSRYHSHHHSSIVTEPITSVIHPFAEHIAYFVLFGIPMLTIAVIGVGSFGGISLYITYIDLMNNMGHCNFEVVPKWFFTVFPPLKFLIYTPSYHSLHHTQFRTNYALFMPFYDYIYGTMDKSTDKLYETSLKKPEDVPDVVHLTHLTTPQSIYYLRLGFASLASEPLTSKWYLSIFWPVTLCSMTLTCLYGRTFILERNTFGKIRSQLWALPRYSINYRLKWQREGIDKLIEEAILDADVKGIKVVSLGLLNQGEQFNRNGEVYVEKHPKLKVKVVDGSSLVVAVVLNSIPKETSHVVFSGRICKVAFSVVSALCRKGIKVHTIEMDEHARLIKGLLTEHCDNLIPLPKSCAKNHKVWLVGETVTQIEQSLASKGTVFIPFSSFPPEKTRKDCSYLNTPAMLAPKSFANLHACENWLPRRVMSAWRIAGIVHALEGWNISECGDMLFDIDKVWKAALHHGFRPLSTPA